MTGIWRFDLGRGRITGSDANAQVMIPAAAMAQACVDLAEESRDNLGAAIGTQLGRRVAEGLSRSIDSALPEEVVERLGAELASMGFGSFGLEFWGSAMVFTVTDSPLTGVGTPRKNSGDRLLAAVIRGALQRAVSRQISLVALDRTHTTVRFLACNQAAGNVVEAWLDQGCHYAEALARLNKVGAA